MAHIALILQLAITLLISAQAPNISIEKRLEAERFARQAIEIATKAIITEQDKKVEANLGVQESIIVPISKPTKIQKKISFTYERKCNIVKPYFLINILYLEDGKTLPLPNGMVITSPQGDRYIIKNDLNNYTLNTSTGTNFGEFWVLYGGKNYNFRVNCEEIGGNEVILEE